MSVPQAHKKLGHINERAMKEIAKNLGWSLTDNQLMNCLACMAGKVKQKSLKKVSVLDHEGLLYWGLGPTELTWIFQ